MEEGQKKPVFIGMVANKGGVGKTRHTILLGNLLGAYGYSVSIWDMDFNNSTTFFYSETKESIAASEEKNMAELIARETNNPDNFTIPTLHPGVSIIPSSRYLADFRTVSEKRLLQIRKNMGNGTDFVIIDCHPTYDNLLINVLNVSDFIINPVFKDLDSYNAACFLHDKIDIDTGKLGNWFLTINGYDHNFENAAGGKQREYIEAYKNATDKDGDPYNFQIVPKECWFPWTAEMNEIKDQRKKLSKYSKDGSEDPLYKAVVNFAKCFADLDDAKIPEAF
jgi:hypothetical protein